jgi:hypothetical protein
LHRSRKLLIASSSVRDGIVVPAIHILRVALKPPILLAILGMLRSDSSTTLFKSLVSACSSNPPETSHHRFDRVESMKKRSPESIRPRKVHFLFERADSRPPIYRLQGCREQPVKRSAQGLNILPASLWVQGISRSLASDQRFEVKIDNVFWNFKRATPVFTKLRSGQNARCLSPDLKAVIPVVDELI